MCYIFVFHIYIHTNPNTQTYIQDLSKNIYMFVHMCIMYRMYLQIYIHLHIYERRFIYL